MKNEDSLQPSAESTPHPREGRRLTPPLWVWLVVALAAAVIGVVRWADVFHDHAIANIVTLIAGFAALMAMLVWFFLLSGYSGQVRSVLFAGGLSALAVLSIVLRIEGVSGEMIPRFALRFSRKPDELLRRPPTGLAAGDRQAAVDLTTTSDHDFPQFLGPDRNLTVDSVRLDRDWTGRPPRQLWRQGIGAGWSAFSVVGRYAVTMEQRGELELVTCYEVETGRLCWTHSTKTRFDTVLAGVGPRATPTIDEGMVYALGATGRLLCLDGATGESLWETDLRQQFHVTPEDEEREIPYGRAASPLIVGDLVVVPAGGPGADRWVSLAAFDKRAGELVWQGGNHQIAYCSPALATLAAVEQILIVNQDYASGHDPRTGEVLWEYAWPGKSATNASASQPLPVPPDRVFLSKGYGHGASLVQLVPGGDGTLAAKTLWHDARVMRTKFTNAAVRDGYVYGLSDGILECVDLSTGCRQWKSGRYGHGQILLVDDLLLVLAETGELLLVEATPESPNQVLGQIQALEGKTWNNMALSGPLLLVRNAEEAACYRLPLALAADAAKQADR
ncbi:MAG: PQQ-like beta-propeller repeat protein [Pirellulales bacterium]|nr:PQQ-like beta-propeller repeat protein [Pirellulales bacterium]